MKKVNIALVIIGVIVILFAAFCPSIIAEVHSITWRIVIGLSGCFSDAPWSATLKPVFSKQVEIPPGKDRISVDAAFCVRLSVASMIALTYYDVSTVGRFKVTVRRTKRRINQWMLIKNGLFK